MVGAVRCGQYEVESCGLQGLVNYWVELNSFPRSYGRIGLWKNRIASWLPIPYPRSRGGNTPISLVS